MEDGSKNTGSSSTASARDNSALQPPEFLRQDRLPPRRLVSYRTQDDWSHALPAQGFGTKLPCPARFEESTRLDSFRSKQLGVRPMVRAHQTADPVCTVYPTSADGARE